MILWMDGPDHYGTNAALLANGVYAQNDGVALVANSGPGGQGTCFSIGGGSNDSNLRKVLPGNRSLVAIGLRLWMDVLPGGSMVLMQWSDINNQSIANLIILSTGALQVNAGALSFTTAPVLVANSFQHIECRLKFDAANGGFSIGVNSLPIASSDNIATTAAQCAQVLIHLNHGTGNPRYRDLYIWDDQGTFNNSGMQGDRQVITSLPTADGPEQDWAPESGSQGFPMIDSVPPVDTNFVYANTAGQKSNFTMAPIDTDITSISAVMLVARASKSDAGIGTMALNIGSAGVTGDGAEQSLSTEFIFYAQMFEADPSTTTKWIPAGVNAALPELDRVQ